MYEALDSASVDPVADARSGDLRHWFVAGYGVSRTLPQPGANGSLGDPLMSRLNPLFDKGRLFGTSFTDELQDQKEYVKVLRGLWSGQNQLLPHVTRVELRGRGGVRSAADLVERQRIGVQVGPHEVKTPAVWMSHGYQGTMAWVADLVGQIFLEAKAPVLARDMEGIVLIDEIDLHLLPNPRRSLRAVEDRSRTERRATDRFCRRHGASYAPSSAVSSAVGPDPREDVFHALSASIGARRRIPEREPAVCEGGDVSRQAVTKHLQILASVGLVRGSRDGRENVWKLEPRRLAEARRLLDVISKEWDETLERLRAFVED